MSFMLSSPAFGNGDPIPDTYALDGANLSPPLEWRNPPDGTLAYALIVEDPDAPRGTFHHWAVYDISPDRRGLSEGEGRHGSDLCQGANDFGHSCYDGPKPPQGDAPHHYRFRLAALDTDRLNLEPRDKAEDVWEAVRPHILAEADLVGTYQR